MMLPESNWHLEIKANWPRLSAILFQRLETLQSTLLSKIFLSNCSKQLVTPVNLTRNFFLTNYLISRIGSELTKLKTAFYESHFPHCVIASATYSKLASASPVVCVIFVGFCYLKPLFAVVVDNLF